MSGLDVTGDAQLFDRTEPVTVTLRRSGGETEIAVPRALRRSLRRVGAFFGGIQLNGDEVIWNVPDAELDGAELRGGDTIASADGARWRIVPGGVARLTFGTRWRAVCRRER